MCIIDGLMWRCFVKWQLQIEKNWLLCKIDKKNTKPKRKERNREWTIGLLKKKENKRGPRRWMRDQARDVPPSDHLPLSLLILFLVFEKMFIYLLAVVFRIDFSSSSCWFRLILILIQISRFCLVLIIFFFRFEF